MRDAYAANGEFVTVIGYDRQFLYYVSAGCARILLREGDAILFGRQPPVLRLCQGCRGAPEVDRLYFRSNDQAVRVLDWDGRLLDPTVGRRATRLLREGRATLLDHQPPAIRLLRIVREPERRAVNMEQQRPTYLDAQGRIVNWTAYFSEKRDIYIRNVSDTNITFPIIRRNGTTQDVSLPKSPDPLNLTALVAFEDIEASPDFRQIVNRRDPKGRPYVQVMTEEEYRRYYEDMGRANQMSASEAERQAEMARQMYRQQVGQQESMPEPIHRVVEQGSGPAGATHIGEKQRVASTGEFVAEADEIRDPLLVLFHNVSQDIEEERVKSDREGRAFSQANVMQANRILQEVRSMRDLTEAELLYIQAKGYWKSVKIWAGEQLKQKVAAPVAPPPPDELDNGLQEIERQAMTGR